MVWDKDAAGKSCLFNRFGRGSGAVLLTLFVCHFFYLAVGSKPAVIADCRFFGFGLSDIQVRLIADSGLSSSVNIRVKH